MKSIMAGVGLLVAVLFAQAGEALGQGKTEVKTTVKGNGPVPNGPFTITATGTVEVATGDVYQGISYYLLDKNSKVLPGFVNYNDPKNPQPVAGGGPVSVSAYCSNLQPGTYTSILVIEYLKGGVPPPMSAPSSVKITVP